MEKIQPSDTAPTLFQYDALGKIELAGLDVDWEQSTGLNTGDVDRIVKYDDSYVSDIDHYFKKTLSQFYPNNGSVELSSPIDVYEQKQGLGRPDVQSDILLGQFSIFDSFYNEIIETIVLEPDSSRITRKVDYPDSTIDEETIIQSDLPVAYYGKTGKQVTYGYDVLGRLQSVTDGRTGESTTIYYDDENRIGIIEDPAGYETSYAYYPGAGRLATVTDASGRATRYGWDEQGQITHIWGDGAFPMRFMYDEQGRLIEMRTFRQDAGWNNVIWPLGEQAETEQADVTKWSYDPFTGLLITKEYDDGAVVSYTYTPRGKLETRTWSRNQASIVTTYTYDSSTGDLTNIIYSDDTPNITFTRDRLGRLETVSDAVGSRTFKYDSGIIDSDSDYMHLDVEKITGNLYNRTIRRGYSSDQSEIKGRFKYFYLTENDSPVPKYSISYGYDDYGRIGSVTGQVPDGDFSRRIEYAYVSASDLIEKTTYENGPETTRTYDSQRDLITRIENRNKERNNALSWYKYTYDQLGNVKQRAKGGLAPSQAYVLKMNQAQQEQAEWYEYPEYIDENYIKIAPETRKYEYDNAGNRINVEDWDDDLNRLLELGYVTNPLNQYTEIHEIIDDQIPIINILVNISHDADGNFASETFSGNTFQYVYDAENRLKSVEPSNPVSEDVKVSLLYDYMGRRVKKSVYKYNAGSWILEYEKLFVYDGWNVIEEITTTQGQPPESKYYVWGLDLSGTLNGAGGIGGLLSCIDPGESQVYDYLYDKNGNVIQMIAANGEVSAYYEYDPYGNIIYQSGDKANDNPFRFSTKYFDEETGLGNWGIRYYSLTDGRFTTRDPLYEPGSRILRDVATQSEYYGLNTHSYNPDFDPHYTYNRFIQLNTGTYPEPVAYNPEDLVNPYMYVGNNPVNLIDPYGLVGQIPLNAIKTALRKVHKKLGGPLPKGKPGKHGQPQRGNAKKGYRLDKEGHPKSNNPNEQGPHINYWDYTKGKRGKGGISDAEPIVWGVVGFIGSLLDPFGAEALANPEEDADGNGIPDYLEMQNSWDENCP